MVNDSGDSLHATPEEGPDNTGDELQMMAPPAKVAHPAGQPLDAASWRGQHKASLFAPVLSNRGVCLAFAVLPNLIFSGAPDLCLF